VNTNRGRRANRYDTRYSNSSTFRHPHGERGARQHLEQADRCGVVRISRSPPERSADHGHETADHKHAARPQPEGEERKYEVRLLLDGEAPHVGEWSESGVEDCSVSARRGCFAPVLDIPDRRKRITGDPTDRIWVNNCGSANNHNNHHECSG
jgi:hypothetical protein